ncbi:uncharacterized protein LOC133815065 [Humulus lupulus]|uniref:uncharacterized protein LOC133815065 n=1 Tax=Humulus lupulus TaxID=3486 RepID=UPI002B415D46|nr:uncharacterized protein LOC133815065 [Humulus lupulus]
MDGSVGCRYIRMIHESVQEANETNVKIRNRMIASQDRHKSYANLKRKDVEFVVGDSVLLRVSPMKGIKRFGKKEKLSTRYVGPFEILERVGQNETFNLQGIFLYEEKPKHIIDQKEKMLRNKRILLVKVLWKNNAVEEAKWELEKDMLEQYLELFS